MKMWWKMVNWWLFALFVAYEPERAFHEFQFNLFAFTVTIAMNSIRCRAWSSPWGGQTPCLSRSWHSQWAWPTKTDMPTEDPARFVLVKDCESPQCNISRYLYNYLVEFFGWFLTRLCLRHRCPCCAPSTDLRYLSIAQEQVLVVPNDNVNKASFICNFCTFNLVTLTDVKTIGVN